MGTNPNPREIFLSWKALHTASSRSPKSPGQLTDPKSFGWALWPLWQEAIRSRPNGITWRQMTRISSMKLLTITQDRGMPLARSLLPMFKSVANTIFAGLKPCSECFFARHSPPTCIIQAVGRVLHLCIKTMDKYPKRPDALEPKWTSGSETMLEAALA